MYNIKYTQPKRAGFDIKPIVPTERNRMGRKTSGETQKNTKRASCI